MCLLDRAWQLSAFKGGEEAGQGSNFDRMIQSHYALTVSYNITKAKRTLWLVNSASTVYPWVYAADVHNN